jgi:hypothetical protein
MALDRTNLIALAKATAKASLNPSANFSYEGKNLTFEALNETFRKEMNELASNFREYRRNRDLIFELIEVGVDEILPARVMQNYGQFAEVKTYAQGDKPIFSTRISAASKIRAKNNFVTRVGLAGRYEVFKLDGLTYEVPTSAWGGAAQIGFEEFLDGRIQMSDVYDLVLEGMDEAVYREIAKGLDAAVAKVPAKNKTTQTGFVEAQMDRLIQTADVYGKSTIYCTFEFAATMIPDDRWASNEMKQERWDVGYYASYKGHNVIILPQSFTDIDNAVKVMDPSKAYIIPTGSDKPVKVAFEGETAVREVESQEDWSREIQTYRKFGVGVVLVNPGICVYTNGSLSINN